MTGGSMTLWDLFKKPAPLQPGLPAPEPDLDQQLRGCAQAVLEDWAGLSPAFLGRPGSRPQAGMVCLGAALDGPRRGLLCASASHPAGALLAVEATGDPGAGSFSGEALRELCQRLREALVQDAFGQAEQDYLFHAPVPLSFERWPLRAPDVALSLGLNGHLLELRLWID